MEEIMKKLKITSFALIALLFFVSCSNKEKEISNEKKDFIRYTQVIIESFGDTPEDSAKETIDYIYENPNDYFWKTAIYKDSEGKTLKTIEREFDSNRFPAKEFSKEDSVITESVVLKYDTVTYEVTEKITYYGSIAPENKIREERYYFDKDGYIESQDVTLFENDPNFKNIEGNNIKAVYTLVAFPAKTARPKGSIMPTYFVEKYKSYFTEEDKGFDAEAAKKLKIGDVYVVEETKFNEQGIPTYYMSTQPECEDHPGKEWFKSDLDGIGNIASITSYANEKMDSLITGCTKKVYEYNDQGFIVKIQEFKYNVATKEFDLPHDLMTFDWADPQINSFANFIDVSKRIEHTCTHSNRLNVLDKKVEKYADGEKVVTESRVSYPIDSIPQTIEPKLRKKTTYKYEKVSK